MLPSELFAPHPRLSSHWLTAAIAAIAGIAAFVILSFFVDALHLSIARGEALRLSPGTDIAVGTASTRQNPPATSAQLQIVSR